MPSIINAATSGGLISTADTSGVLQLQTASTTAMTIDASQLVGIGTTTPAYQLQVSKAGQTNLYVNNTTSGVALRMIADSANGYVQTQSNHPLILAVNNGVAAIEVNTSNNVRLYGNLGVGNTVPSTSGTGITFPATQSASSNANTLDDYEEGTWTPTLTFGGASVGIAYTYQAGFYTKIGNTVTVQYVVFLSSKGSSTGDNQISGLPFSTANNDTKRAGAYQFTDRVTANQLLTNNNSTIFSLQTIPATSVTSAANLTNTDFSATTYISGTFTYLL
jgi:hypothetical protein